MTREKLTDYVCSCGHEHFRVRNSRIKYRGDTRIEPILACSKCGRTYQPGFTGTGGLRERSAK